MANKDVQRYSVYLGKQEAQVLEAVAGATHVTPRQYIKGALLEMLRATIETARDIEQAKMGETSHEQEATTTGVLSEDRGSEQEDASAVSPTAGVGRDTL